MRVVLRSDVEGVGHRGDLIDVADGFARNYLLPQGRAIPATRGIQVQATAMRKSRDLRAAKDREAAEAKAKVLAGASVNVAARASATGRLFGSVGPAEVVDGILDQLGVTVGRDDLELEEPIKTVGVTEVMVTLHDDVVTVINVEVKPAG